MPPVSPAIIHLAGVVLVVMDNELHLFLSDQLFVIVLDTNFGVIVVSLTTWEAHHSPRAVVNFPGQTPVPHRSGTRILDLSHHPI